MIQVGCCSWLNLRLNFCLLCKALNQQHDSCFSSMATITKRELVSWTCAERKCMFLLLCVQIGKVSGLWFRVQLLVPSTSSINWLMTSMILFPTLRKSYTLLSHKCLVSVWSKVDSLYFCHRLNMDEFRKQIS